MVETRENVSSSSGSYEFFKVYVPEFSSHELVIPPAFIINFNGSLPKKATLKDHAGKLWHVDLYKDEEQNVLITKVWQDFVSYHSLEYGDFFIFDFDGNSEIDVKVFSKNGRRKDLGYTTNTRIVSVKEEQEV